MAVLFHKAPVLPVTILPLQTAFLLITDAEAQVVQLVLTRRAALQP